MNVKCGMLVTLRLLGLESPGGSSRNLGDLFKSARALGSMR